MTGPDSGASESAVLAAWERNANRWAALIAADALPSRREVTNAALLAVIDDTPFNDLLDVGCGEGWLLRTLRARRPDAPLSGVDGAPGLVATAASADPESHYWCAAYSSLTFTEVAFDLAVFNFSLFDEDGALPLLSRLTNALPQSGHVIIQTLHAGDRPSGWETNAWQGLPGAFEQPYPWYRRGFDDWLALFEQAGLSPTRMLTTRSTATGEPCSSLFVLGHRG